MKEQGEKVPESVIIERPDGSTVSIPPGLQSEVVQFQSTDRVARALLVGSFAVNAVLAGGWVYSRWRDSAEIHRVEEKIEQTMSPRQIAQIKGNVDKLLVAVCVNEGMLKAAMGGRPYSLDECQEEWDEWLREPPPIMPQP